MKVAFIGFNLSENRKEAVRNIVYGLARTLKKNKIEVFIITNGSSNRVLNVEGLKVYEIKSDKTIYKLGLNLFEFISGVKLVIEKEKPDVIHDHFVLSGSSFLVTSHLKKFNKIKFVKSIYNKPLSFKDFNKIISPFNFRYLMYEGFIRLVLDNRFLAKFVFSKFKYLIYHDSDIGRTLSSLKVSTKHAKLPIGINRSSFTREKDQEKNRYFNLSYLGHASFKKGLDIFLDAGAVLLHKNQSIRLNFAISDTAEASSRYKKKILKLKRKFPGRVILLGKVTPREFFSNSDIVVFPLLHDWSAISPPLSIIEAMSSGSIVLAANVCGAGEFIKDKNNGFLLEKNNKEYLVESIESIQKYGDLSKMRERAIKSALDFDWNKLIQRYIKIYGN